jgi:hypothetical protein
MHRCAESPVVIVTRDAHIAEAGREHGVDVACGWVVSGAGVLANKKGERSGKI